MRRERSAGTVSRREFLGTAGAALLLACGVDPGAARAATAHPAVARGATAHPAAAGSPLSFVSRPDLRPPAATLTGTPPPAAEGYSFVAPTPFGGAQVGPLMLDANGQPVWFEPLPRGLWAMNFRVQEYRGEPVLTWWQGAVIAPGYGQGEGIIMDVTLTEIARVRAGNGRRLDLHEFILTPQGTALVTCYPPTVDADLSPVGGAREGQVLESIVQEIDVATGRVLLEWRSLDHVPVSESLLEPGGVYDYLHANSIDLTPDGHLIVSGRHTWAVYKLDRRTGEVIWRLGGNRSDFGLPRGSRFSWQHDARHLGGTVITLFDDGAGQRRTERQSRGLVLELGRRHHTVRLLSAYRNPTPLLASAMGSMQLLPDGNAVIGWGNVSALSGFTAAGQLAYGLSLPFGRDSYRSLRFPWSATPTAPPDIAVGAGATASARTVYASWNGATAVAAWRLSAGPSAAALAPVAVANRTGFETAIPVAADTGYVAVTALDGSGRSLSASAAVAL